MTIDLTLPDMSCGHCEKTIRSAIAALDPQATVRVDLATHQVHIDTDTPREQIVHALAEEGYPPAA